MTMTPRLAEYLRKQPNRCPECLWNEKTQGHAPTCERGLRAGREAMAATTEKHGADAAMVDRVLEAVIARGEPFSLNEIRPRLRHIGERSVIGARVQAFARARRIKDTGARVKSTDPGTHGAEIKVWRPVA